MYEQSNAEYGQWGKEQYMSAMEEAKCVLLVCHLLITHGILIDRLVEACGRPVQMEKRQLNTSVATPPAAQFPPRKGLGKLTVLNPMRVRVRAERG